MMTNKTIDFNWGWRNALKLAFKIAIEERDQIAGRVWIITPPSLEDGMEMTAQIIADKIKKLLDEGSQNSNG